MPNAHALANYFATALAVGLHAALPVIVAVAVAALLASILQAFIGFGDPALGLTLRLIGATAALVLFGHWTIDLVLRFWQTAWHLAAAAMGVGP